MKWYGAAALAIAVLMPSTASAKNVNQLSKVATTEVDGTTSIMVHGTSTPIFTVYKLDNPERVVLDLSNATLASSLRDGDGKAVWQANTWAVGSVSGYQRDGSGSKVRFVVNLARTATYRVRAVGTNVEIRVTPREKPKAPVSAAERAKLEAQRQAIAKEREQTRAEAERLAEVRQKAAKQSAEAEKARLDAARESERAAELLRKANEMRERAVREVAAARAEVQETKAAAAKESARAASDRALADKRLADADKMMKEASARMKQARATEERARTVAAKAKEREASADQSEKRARAAEVSARKAEVAARESKKRAAERKGTNEAVALEKRAAELAAKAQAERQAAEQALAIANQARRDATQAAKLARLEREKAAGERALAEKEQREAERKQSEAKQALARAEERRKAAEADAREAEDKVAAMRSSLRDIAAQVEKAKALRAKEERALAEAKAARKSADSAKLRSAEAEYQAVAAKTAAARRELEKAEAARREYEEKAAAARAQLALQRKAADDHSKLDAERQKKAARARIHKVEFEEQGETQRIVIGLSSPVAPRADMSRDKQAILVIPGASITPSLEKTIDTSKFSGPVKAVSTYRDPKHPSDVKVVVDLKESSKGVVKRVGNDYYIDFAANKQTAAQTTAKKPRATSYRAPVLASAASTPITQATVSRMGRGRKVYRGRPIDLDFKDADIHNLLRLLADVGGVNIVIPDEIKASVTVRLRRVPWDQAMEVILASKGLWYRRQGDLIRVAPRRELVKEDEDEAARIKALAAQEPPEPEIFPLNYATANQVRTQLQPLLSPRGRIEVDTRSNSLIINDVRAHRRRIIDMVRRLDTQTPQIQIEARIVEARTTFTREFGIQWGGNSINSTSTGNATGLIFPSTVAIAGAADDGQANSTGVTAAPTNFAVNMPAAIGANSGAGLGFSFGSVGGNFNLNLRLSALEDTGTIRTVSQPKITVLNNVQASISSGVSIPISVVSANGVNTQFVPADLKLSVTPSVSQRDCSISMAVTVSNNQADFANTGARGDPSILRREASTQILVGDGETSVIGGIYTRSTGRSYNKVPFFSDLPIIGLLFKSRRDVDERAEVLVFITPTITNRAYLPCE